MEFATHDRPRPRLSIAPLIDVVFLLLVFFMLASSFIEPAAIDLAMSRPQAAPQAAAEPLVVDVRAGGEVRLNGLALALDQLGPEIAARPGAAGDRPVTVRAEAEVPVALLVAVMDRLRGAGFANLRLATPEAR
ncbi:MAG TPA: biopolymer transporter ExbD [Alphaproteobacteria bacterium]